MRVIIQRVSKATVTIRHTVKRESGPGLLILAGFEDEEDISDLDWLAAKIVNLRIFDDENGVMNRSLLDTNGELMLISQFTLHASTRKGNRPSYIRAARPEKAEPLYRLFREKLETLCGMPVVCGEFGAFMQVELVNEGPVTICIDTKNKE